MKQYVLGFVLEIATENVLLIEKNRPTAQAGKLNGIGGKIEANESPEQAIVREIEEETGLIIEKEKWLAVDKFGNENFKIYTFVTCIPDLSLAYSKTDEKVSIHKTSDIASYPNCVHGMQKFLFDAMNALHSQVDKENMQKKIPKL